MSTPSADRAAVILCGGLSTRMGRSKAMLPFGPETLLQRVVRISGEVCGERVVVAAADQELPPLPDDVNVVIDEVPEQGPLEGISVGLGAVRAPAAFCVPCDVPFLRSSLVSGLFDALGEADAVRPVMDGFPQPLLAVYRTTLAGRAASLVAEGRRRIIFLVEDRTVVDLDEESVRALDSDGGSFRNCNTPDEYAVALRDAGWSG